MNVTPQETRVAVLDEGVVQELHLERSATRGIVGNIYRGKVVRVLAGMQAAFVDIGLDKNGFLHAADIIHSHRGVNRDADVGTDSSANSAPRPIQDLVHQGQSIWVQVLKDPIADKGARLSTELSIASRNLVYLPNSNSEIGISQKIECRTERARLRSLIANQQEVSSMTGGFIIRTQAESARDADLAADISFIQRLWAHTCAAMKTAKPATLVYEDLPLVLRSVRDLITKDLMRIRIDSKSASERVSQFTRECLPDVVDKIEFYSGATSLFDEYSVDQEIDRALQAKVMLESGGDLVIDQNEAMTTIDINTGSYVGRKDHNDTVLKTNLEAAGEIAHQLRLRNCGGIIIIDFIDMSSSNHNQQVLTALEAALDRDPVKTRISQMSPLGLVELTRKRTRESLRQQMCEYCEVCLGSGMVKTVQTVCYEISREILREDNRFKAREYTVIASPMVVDQLQGEKANALADLQQHIERPINLKVDPLFKQQQYDIVLS